jgi:hypothetical protein
VKKHHDGLLDKYTMKVEVEESRFISRSFNVTRISSNFPLEGSISFDHFLPEPRWVPTLLPLFEMLLINE